MNEAAIKQQLDRIERKDIGGYNGDYQITSSGMVLSKRFGKVKELALGKDTNGYLFVGLRNKGVRKGWWIARLVAEHFLSKIPGKTLVNHKNGIKTDNRVENLEWCDNSENMKHAYAAGLNKGIRGKRFSRGGYKPRKDLRKLSDEQCQQVILLCRTGTPQHAVAKIYGVGQSTISRLVIANIKS
jgi:hypothetical protein